MTDDRMERLPYGIASFRQIRDEGLCYVDKTRFIEKLEALKSPYPFIVRPRRFGKTLFTRLLEAYYDQAAAPRFEDDFRGTYIDEHRTAGQGQYCVLHLDFSGLDENEVIPQFNTALWMGFKDFFRRYPTPGAEELLSDMLREPEGMPARFMMRFVATAADRVQGKLFIIIDEYDQFANELLAKDPDQFRQVTGTGGFLKNFYTQIKKATDSSVASRVFITGVTVVSLDSLTSGFSIANDITRHPDFADLYGFTETELRELIDRALKQGVKGLTTEAIFTRMKDYYNGYRFSPQSPVTVFNASMCLYYLQSLQETGKEPNPLLDKSVGVDIRKMDAILALGPRDYVAGVVKRVVEGKSVPFGGFPESISLQDRSVLAPDDVLAILYYLGFLTLDKTDASALACPNRGILNQFFLHYLRTQENLPHFRVDDAALAEVMKKLQSGDLKAYLQFVADRMTAGAGLHAAAHFNEACIQTAVKTVTNLTNFYRATEETEALGVGYTDVLLTPTNKGPAYLLELKYLKPAVWQRLTSTERQAKLTETLVQAKAQLVRYAAAANIRAVPNLTKAAAVFVGTTLAAVEDV